MENGYPGYKHELGHQRGPQRRIRSGFSLKPTISGEVNIGLEDDIVVEKKAKLLSHPQKEIILI